MKYKIFLLIYLIFLNSLIFNCKKNVEGIPTNGVIINALESSLKITNNHSSTIHFFIVERGTAAIIDWSPSCNPDDKNQVQFSNSKSILYEEILGYKKNCEVIVYWWFCIKKTGESNLSPDNFQSEVVKTK